MYYLAPITLNKSLLTLRERYQENTKVNFNAPAPSSFAAYYGSKDIKTRNRQIQIIEAFAKHPLPQHTTEGKDAYVEKMRLMVGICYLTQQKIISQNKITPVYSELNKLITDALQISSNNQLDKETLENCLLVFENYDLKKVNAQIGKHNITPVEWAELRRHSYSIRSNLQSISDSQFTNNLSYTIGCIAQPAGWGFGFALGQTLGQAGQTGVVKTVLTSSLQSGLLLLAPLTGASTNTVTFFSEPCINKSIKYGTAFAAAETFRFGAKHVGRGVGWIVGKSLELAYDTSSKLGKKTYNYITDSPELDELDIKMGIDLVNEELSSKSNSLNNDEVIEKIKKILQKTTSSQESKNQVNVVPFRLSEEEYQLVPEVLKNLGYATNDVKPEELLEFEEVEEAESLTT